MNVNDVRKLETLGEENAKLKRLLAEQVMDVSTLEEMLAKTSDAWFKESCRGLAINEKSYKQRKAAIWLAWNRRPVGIGQQDLMTRVCGSGSRT